jgi:hypothetical protein
MRPILSASFVLTLLTVVGLVLNAGHTGFFREAAIREALQAATPAGTLDARVEAALERGDIDAALQYRELGTDLGKPVAPSTAERLEAAQSLGQTVMRNVGDFAGAYVTGAAETPAGLAGAVVSDLTVVGDVRDILTEGGKAALGEDYSRVLLGLAAAGLAAEGAIIATGGSSLPVKAALSVLKAARRTGNLTAELATLLVRQARLAAGGPLIGGARRIDLPAADAARLAARARLGRTYETVGTVAANAGTAEAVRLMRHVRGFDDLDDVAKMSARFGPRTRAVIELTGKTSLRGFRLAVKTGRLLVWAILTFLGWLAGLLAFTFVKRLAKFAIRRLRRLSGLPATAGRRRRAGYANAARGAGPVADRRESAPGAAAAARSACDHWPLPPVRLAAPVSRAAAPAPRGGIDRPAMLGCLPVGRSGR